MLNSYVNVGLFTGYVIVKIPIFDLSSSICWWYVAFRGEKLGNIRALKENLILFELVLGLKVNFHKRFLVGVNVEESRLAWKPPLF